MAKNHGKKHQAGGFASPSSPGAWELGNLWSQGQSFSWTSWRPWRARVFRIQARWEFLTGFENGPDWAVGGMINSDISWYGYGSIPINTIFRGMNIHKSQLFWCELQGYKVLTHCHMIKHKLKQVAQLSWQEFTQMWVMVALGLPRSHRTSQNCPALWRDTFIIHRPAVWCGWSDLTRHSQMTAIRGSGIQSATASHCNLLMVPSNTGTLWHTLAHTMTGSTPHFVSKRFRLNKLPN